MVSKYSKNIKLLGFLKSLRSVDGEDLQLWPSTDDYQEIKTPKFDMIAQRYRSVVSSENRHDPDQPEKITIAVTKTGGRFPHTDVRILPGLVVDPQNGLGQEKAGGSSSSLDTIQTEHVVSNSASASDLLGEKSKPPEELVSPCARDYEENMDKEMRARVFLLRHVAGSLVRRRLQRSFAALLLHTYRSSLDHGHRSRQQAIEQELEQPHEQDQVHISSTVVDMEIQTDQATEDVFPEVAERVHKQCSDEFALREKELLRDFMQAELKLKNDLAFKTQMIEATEKKRVYAAVQLNEEIAKLRAELEEARTDGARCGESAMEAQAEAKKFLLLHTEAVGEIAAMKERLRESDADRNEQKDLLRDSKENADLARAEVQRLTDIVATLNAQRTEEYNRAEKARELAENQQLELLSVLKDRVTDSDRISTLREAELHARMESERLLDSWKVRCQTATELYETLKTETSQRLQLLETKCEKQKRSLAEMRAVMKELKDVKTELSAKYQEAQHALQLSKEAEEATRNAAEKQSAALNDKLVYLEREFSSLSSLGKTASNPQRVNELERKCSDLETSLRVKTTMLDDQNDAMRKLRERNVELEVRSREADRDMDALEEDIRGLKKIVADLEMQLDHKSTVEADLRRLVAKLTRDLGSGSIGVSTIKEMLHRAKSDRYSEDMEERESDDEFYNDGEDDGEGDDDEGPSFDGDDADFDDRHGGVLVES